MDLSLALPLRVDELPALVGAFPDAAGMPLRGTGSAATGEEDTSFATIFGVAFEFNFETSVPFELSRGVVVAGELMA